MTEPSVTPQRREEWDRLREQYLLPSTERPPSVARGVHHLALLCSDLEQTIEFYVEVVGFPLVELFENRDYPGSTHFFFDIGHGNLLAFFDFPDLGLADYREVHGGLHHLAISVTPEQFDGARDRLEAAGVAIHMVPGVDESMYFPDPDGVRLELIRSPLHEMGGHSLID